MRLIFGEKAAESEDITKLVETVDPQMRPALWIDCGTEDFLIDQNRAMHAHLDKLGIPHHYSERPGEHGWAHWDAVIQEALGFVRRELSI